MAGLAALKNFINLHLTPNNEPNIGYIQSMSPENIKQSQERTQQYINKFETQNSFAENVDMTMYLDRLYKIRNALELYMRNNPNLALASPVDYDSDEMVSYGGIRYKRRSKRRTNKRSKRRNTRKKHNTRFSRCR